MSPFARSLPFEGARFHEQRYKEYGARLADLGDLGNALPLGLQLTAGHGNEAGLPQTAVRLEQLLREVQ